MRDSGQDPEVGCWRLNWHNRVVHARQKLVILAGASSLVWGEQRQLRTLPHGAVPTDGQAESDRPAARSAPRVQRRPTLGGPHAGPPTK